MSRLKIISITVSLFLLGFFAFWVMAQNKTNSSPSDDKLSSYSATPVPIPPLPPPQSQPQPSASPSAIIKPMTWSTPPALEIDPAKKYTAKLMTTAGPLTIDLNAKSAPQTVNNFVFLARQKFYDNTIFHRVIKDFMIQGGDPLGTGTGGPGYKFPDEPITEAYTRGTVAMANSGPNTNGSQFFIMHADYALSKNYVIFGHVVSGLDTLDKIATAPVTTSVTGEASSPVTPVKITSVEITP